MAILRLPMLSLYSLLTRITFIGALPFAAWRLLTRPQYRKGAKQKMGFDLPSYKEKTIWIHAVSVGEVLAALPLVDQFGDYGKKIVVTVTTPTGHDTAIKIFAGKADVLYFPLDLPGAVRRFVTAINPALFVTIDTEIWPNVVAEAKKHGAVTAIVNGRISDRSWPRYMRFAFFFRTALKPIDLFLMQSREDEKRIITIGADHAKVFCEGNLKFDRKVEDVSAEERGLIRHSIGIGPGELVILLGSIHEGEEVTIKAAVEVLNKKGKGRLVIAPRRIENIDWIKNALEGSGFLATRKSEMVGEQPDDSAVVPVIDTFGELSRLYSVADIVVVGGSFIPHGGQNPLEPASFAKAPIIGPSMENFRDVAKSLLNAGGAFQTDEEGLAAIMTNLIESEDKREQAGAQAKQVLEESRGAAKRMADRLKEKINAKQ